MSEFKRYEFVFTNDFGEDFPASERAEFDGEYVKYEVLASSMAREAALREELETQDRVLRSSVPEHCKHATCPVGSVQNYIAELEHAGDALQQRLNVAEKLFDAAVTALNEIAKVSRIGEKPFEIATLAIGEMSALKPVEGEWS